MYRWGDGLNSYRTREKSGEDVESIISTLEERRRGLVENIRPDNEIRVREAIDQTDEYIRQLKNPSSCKSDAW